VGGGWHGWELWVSRSVGSQSKFFVREEPGMDNDCPLYLGSSQGIGCGVWPGVGKVGGDCGLVGKGGWTRRRGTGFGGTGGQ